MKKFRNLLIWMTVVLMNCTSVRVVSHFDESTDFGEFLTYGIRSKESFSDENMREKDKLEGAIIDEMESRGYQFSSNPELTVRYQIILGSRTDVRTDQNSYSGFGYWSGYTTIRVRQYSEGILLVEVRNNESKLLWHSSLDLSFNRKNRKDIVSLINLVFKEYPVLKPGNESGTDDKRK